MDEVEAATVASAAVHLTHVQLRNFRCFEQFEIDIKAPYVIFAGANGVGKTSLLEALYYACYLRSFRTHIPKELISFGKQEFFIKISLDSAADPVSHAIQVGFAPHKRLVKVDQKPITSYKELMTYYRIVSVTESDLDLIQGSPHNRRLFLDQILLFLDATYATVLKDYRQMVDQRNALLQHRSFSRDTYIILTEQVWKLSLIIQEQRMVILDQLATGIDKQRLALFPYLSPLEFIYKVKRPLGISYDEFLVTHSGLIEQEQRFRRTLFGAHLDDIHIIFQGQSSRLFASRGQQKLIVMLIKMAQLALLLEKGIPAICLLDDFMTDFDGERMITVLNALESLGTQLIFTTPLEQTLLTDHLVSRGAQTVKLTI
jgi:DNA replication and repair protein RecF